MTMSTHSSNGIAIDEAAHTLRITRSYAAGVERAWWAWTDADAIATWWGPQGWSATVHEMNVHPEGRWRFEIAPDDGSADPVRSIATYTQVERDTRLAYDDSFVDETWAAQGLDVFPTTVTFTPILAGCTVEVTANFPDARALQRAVELQMGQGYAEALDRLALLLGDPAVNDTTASSTPTTAPTGDSTMTRTLPATTAAATAPATLTSADGTTIAYDKSGIGPAIIVISNVAEDRSGVAGIAEALAKDFTVITYDRRGRGASGNPQPYNPRREIDDLAALIEVAGGSAALTSGSGGCALALDAASALGDKVTGLYLYEPPFIVSDSRPAAPTDYPEQQAALVANGKRSEAVEHFMTQMVGVPAEYIPMMKQDPSWDQMMRYAHTYAYDGQILRGLQDGRPLPTDRWTIEAPVGVAVGGLGESFICEGAQALANLLPNVTILTLADHDHSAFWVHPDAVATQARKFLLG
ncbi:alpha/beta fold hydrolase [Nocardioides sp. S-58]|uniref:Alpha/beta fold hydrolase n=1 Tax=Nocardioides renjunii TaxID=3095075 RepID=A0ABU5KES2_9ACTN|nr:alpha/beta fold hydrolase [Nocardioides sp. S-58]MDZ5663371.1 alpha/beta fold hydrolase [Nocardioides sp. S-58]